MGVQRVFLRVGEKVALLVALKVVQLGWMMALRSIASMVELMVAKRVGRSA